MAVGQPSGGPRSLCLAGANYCTLLKWHLGVPLLPADCAGRPCHLCGWPLYIFVEESVPCKKSGIGDRHLGTQFFFFQVLTQARIPHDRQPDIAGNGRLPTDILPRAWDGRPDVAVNLAIVQPNPATGWPLRGSAATSLRDIGEQKNRESADSCGRMGVDFSPMVFYTWECFHWAGKTSNQTDGGPPGV